MVSGRILLNSWSGPKKPVSVFIRLQDTSRIDAPATTIVEEIRHDIPVETLVENGMEFSISVKNVVPRARYQVRVLVDLDGDGEASIGDYITTSSYPVLTRGYPNYIEVMVHPIG